LSTPKGVRWAGRTRRPVAPTGGESHIKTPSPGTSDLWSAVRSLASDDTPDERGREAERSRVGSVTGASSGRLPPGLRSRHRVGHGCRCRPLRTRSIREDGCIDRETLTMADPPDGEDVSVLRCLVFRCVSILSASAVYTHTNKVTDIGDSHPSKMTYP
jgi:hypothetical protein